MNGIGGKSIVEVKRNLTYAEINKWAVYRQRRGSLNISRRVDQATARLGSYYLNQGREAHNMIDPVELMPFEDDVIESFEEQLSDS